MDRDLVTLESLGGLSIRDGDDNDALMETLATHLKIPTLYYSAQEITIINHFKFDDYVRKGYFVFQQAGRKPAIALNNLTVLPKLLELDSTRGVEIMLVGKKDFYLFLESAFSEVGTLISVNLLEYLSSKFTARNINYKISAAIFFTLFFSVILLTPTAFHIFCNMCYFLQNSFKLLLFNKGLGNKGDELIVTKIGELPIYTILVPLYKEAHLVGSILRSIANLDYPKDRLDVKLIVEADDDQTVRVIESRKLPVYVHVIKVPHSQPRTKPKALNYAIQYATGKFLVIYDAEDRPHPLQLKKAIAAFDNLPEEYVCLQARLNFYNKEENLLTKFFSMEYHLWFDYLLGGLSKLNLPVTLGGTSNHFKTATLRQVGLWDAFNVTEDADLGLRLYLRGYRVTMLDSDTLEESPLGIGNWVNQRARWIKGFIQTFLVFLRQENNFKKLNLRQYFAVCIFVGLSAYNFFCLPWVIFFIYINDNEVLSYLWLINSLFAFTYLYAVAAYILLKEKADRKLLPFWSWVCLSLWPLYFLLHTVACYKAVWEICTRPFKWNKTEHGITKQG